MTSAPRSSSLDPHFEDLHRMLVCDQSSYAIVLLDRTGVFRSWNSGIEHLFGYAQGDFIGQPLELLFTPEDRQAGVPQAEMEASVRLGKSTDTRWKQRRDGSRFFGTGVLTCLRDSHGEVIGFSKIVSDETLRKHLEDRLLESNRMLEQFVQVVSHDLQEPLRTVNSFAELVLTRSGGAVDPETRKALGFIGEAATRMSRLVRDLLAFSTQDALEARPGPVALDEIVEAVCANLTKAIADSGADVTHDPLPVVNIDPTQAMQLFQNLVENGLKYSRPGVAPKIHMSSEKMDGEWLVRVADNGTGFDPERASTIFEPFTRLHARQTSGTGLGLTTVRRIVQRHGGRIWAETEPGRGTVFLFTIAGAKRNPVDP
ncbi:MAG TPA: ATP-binding protein [Bryobacteraceae bacterium]|nr:ATP-binding protein [Bryobacteraceae bacterium]